MRPARLDPKTHHAADYLIEPVTRQSYCARFLWFLVGFILLFASGIAVFGMWFCANSVNIRYWWGELPLINCAFLFCSLLLADFVLFYDLLVTSFRSLAKWAWNGEERYRLSRRGLKVLLIFLMILSLASVVMGSLLLNSGLQASSDLMIDCNTTSRSAAVELQYQLLLSFREECLDNDDSIEHLKVEACPGFYEEFPHPRPFVEYLKVMEFYQGCSGWCQSAKPLFNTNKTTSDEDEGCAWWVGTKLWVLSFAISIPTITAGSLLALLSVLMFAYDRL